MVTAEQFVCPLHPAQKVELLVNTRKGAVIEKGHGVLYRRAIDRPKEATPFNTFSSPAWTSLPPGSYIIWSRQTVAPYTEGQAR